MVETTISFIERLNKAILACKSLKEKTDKQNAKMLRTYVSGYARTIKGKDPHPLNMVDRILSIWLPFLIGGLPKIIVRPKLNLQFQPFANTFQIALNQWLKEAKFDKITLEPTVFNSLFSLGITKTGSYIADRRKLAGKPVVLTELFSEAVDLANYVFDVVAMDRQGYEFEGDEYLVPTEIAKEMFGTKNADKIKPDFKLYGDSHPKNIENPDKINYSELRDYTALVDAWIPREKAIFTLLPPHKVSETILNITEYKTCETGPYDVLGYKYYRGSTLPIPPVYGLMELDAAINTLYAKARNQAERMKKIGVGDAGNEKDAETARDAEDGGFYMFNNAAAIKELTLGGVVPEVWDFLGYSQNQISEQGGVTGLDYRMRSKTATQEQMLMANASRNLDMMSQTVHLFAGDISRKLAAEMWRNPSKQIAAIKKMPGIAEIVSVYNQLNQKGKILDYEFDIELYSMQQLSADEKFRRLKEIVLGWVLPTAQISAQQGKMPNIPQITKVLSLYANVESEVEGFYLSEQPQNTQLNPYQQMSGGLVKGGDNRLANEGFNVNNLLAKNQAKAGASTKE